MTIGGHVIQDLRFADDISNPLESSNELQEVMNKIADKAEALGMKTNVEKTEVQYIGKTNEVVDVSLHGNALKQVKEFTYLGSVVASNGTSEKDIDRRNQPCESCIQFVEENMGSKRYFKITEGPGIRMAGIEHTTIRLRNMDYDRINQRSTAKLRDDLPS